MDVRKALVRGSLRGVVRVLLKHRTVRRLLFRCIASQLYKESVRGDRPGQGPTRAKLDRMDCVEAILHGIDRAIERGILSKSVVDSMLRGFLGNVILNEDAKRIEREGVIDPPSFITISPTGKCNLRCEGCYASDAALHGRSLSFETFDRILREKRELWGSHWTVISGGEPFLWRDGDWDIVKLAARHPSDVFMVYTNGTLITDQLAARLAEVGNITPAISVEGFKVQTDARRGEGVYAKILEAFENLRNHGVPFGISATATKDNWKAITCEDFADFYFANQGAIYGWIFQYMPMGRGQTTDLVVPPEARVEMARRMWRLVRERKILIADFWNSGTVSMGCISAARPGGYFHINWDGDIMPCVFIPYAAGNIHDIYDAGGNLNDTLSLPFFVRIREWQRAYGFHGPTRDTGNWLCPCAIRDHFDVFLRTALACGARPINEEARQALSDPAYEKAMVDYGRRMAELTDPIWEEEYLGNGRKPVQASEIAETTARSHI